MKLLYLRQGNNKETQDILIIGEESELGGRDNAYRPNKGSSFKGLRKDPYTKKENLTYIHSVPNIKLDTKKYARDYEIHKFIKEYCKDLVVWDGECSEGRVNSREAFIIKDKENIQKTINALYYRLEDEVHGHHRLIFRKKLQKLLLNIFLFPFRLIISLLILFFKRRKLKKTLKRVWGL